MQKLICKDCGETIKNLTVEFIIVYSSQITLSTDGEYVALLNTLNIETSSLDDEDSLESNCPYCDAHGKISELCDTVMVCDYCHKTIEDLGDYFCKSYNRIICDACADSKVSDMCSWCGYRGDCIIYERHTTRNNTGTLLSDIESNEPIWEAEPMETIELTLEGAFLDEEEIDE